MKRAANEPTDIETKRSKSDIDNLTGTPRTPNGGEPRPTTAGKQPQTVPRPSAPRPTTAGKQPVGTGGKQPTTSATTVPKPNIVGIGGVPGKQPQIPGLGGKHPSIHSNTGGKQPPNGPTAGKQPSITTGTHSIRTSANVKRQVATPPPTTPPTAIRHTPPRPPGVGGKEPARPPPPIDKTKGQTYQPSSALAPSHTRLPVKPTVQVRSTRLPTLRKQHPLIGKTVKVWYVPEGYYNGVVKSSLGGNDFMIQWEDGSTTSATLNDEDETDDVDNEDRWSLVEDIPENQTISPSRGSTGGGNGARSASKRNPPPSYDDEDDNYDDNENEENDNEDT